MSKTIDANKVIDTSVNLKDELTEILEKVADLAVDPTGGITRLLYTEEWVLSQKLLKEQMDACGFNTSFDEVGNLFGRVEGETDETVMTGSHVDTVRNGGKLDGMYGIAAGIVAMRYLKEAFGTPRRSMEVVSFAEEEGSRFPTVFWGSKNFLGIAKNNETEKLADHSGVSFPQAMREAGFDFCEQTPVRPDITHFVEAHIEQGNVLEREGIDIGVVNSIAGQRRFKINLSGVANHAGTTPMEYRHDALYAATRMISTVIGNAKEAGSPLVATTGAIECKPNIVNVVPGDVEFSLDIRHTDSQFLKDFTDRAAAEMEVIAKECGVSLNIDMWMDEDPVPMNDELCGCIEEVCKEQKMNYKVMHSGAGHDSQLLAMHVPTAMIFVPSKDGISHNPAEYTAPELLVNGVHALIGTLYKLAYEE